MEPGELVTQCKPVLFRTITKFEMAENNILERGLILGEGTLADHRGHIDRMGLRQRYQPVRFMLKYKIITALADFDEESPPFIVDDEGFMGITTSRLRAMLADKQRIGNFTDMLADEMPHMRPGT